MKQTIWKTEKAESLIYFNFWGVFFFKEGDIKKLINVKSLIQVGDIAAVNFLSHHKFYS